LDHGVDGDRFADFNDLHLFIRAIRPTLMGDRLSDFVGAVLLLVDKDEAHAT
jgi:hypothetical protein